MCETAEHDLTIEQRTIRVKGVPTDGSFKICCGNDRDIYLVCERSARVYGLTVAEAETFATDILRMVEQMRSGDGFVA
jgi:hypothetical protein